jgi:hypothetical protein
MNDYALKLKKLLDECVTEYHWHECDGGLIIFISYYNLKDFCQFLGQQYWDDGYGYDHTHLCPDGDVSVDDFDYWLEQNDINPEEIFPKEGHLY